MNHYLKIIMLLLLATLFLNISCSNPDEPSMDDGVITGYDLRECACCGGLMINFLNETQSYKGEYYLISNVPADLGISDTAKFPLFVRVNWKKDSISCINNKVTITKIEFR